MPRTAPHATPPLGPAKRQYEAGWSSGEVPFKKQALSPEAMSPMSIDVPELAPGAVNDDVAVRNRAFCRNALY
jgi:hypothetical protein